MATSSDNKLRKLNPKDLKPVYFLHGEEPYFIDNMVADFLEITIPEHEKAFNEYVLYGKDVTVGDILNVARKFPMMAERQLVVVREAQAITDLTAGQSMLEKYARSPVPSTCLVLAFGKKMDERKTWVKAFAERGEIQQFKRVPDYQIPAFITNLCQSEEIAISPKAVQLLTDHMGNNLQAIRKELEKIRINLKEGEGIDAEVIERFVGVSKEFNIFELQKALVDHNSTKAYAIAHYLTTQSKDHSMVQSIVSLYNFFSKVLYLQGLKPAADAELARLLGVSPFFVKDFKKAAQVFPLPKLRRIIFGLRQADARTKGVEAGTMTQADIMKDLLYCFFG